jgi:hypothetical protein
MCEATTLESPFGDLSSATTLLVMFRLVSAYSLSQNTIESAETSRLFHLPNQPIETMEYYFGGSRTH